MCDACRVRQSRPAHDASARGGHAESAQLLADPALLSDRRLDAPQMRAARAGLARQVQHGGGNRAMAQVLARDPTTTAPELPPIVHHKSGADVDAMLLKSGF